MLHTILHNVNSKERKNNLSTILEDRNYEMNNLNKSKKIDKLNKFKENEISKMLDVDFSYCWLNLVEAWYSLEQYIGLKEDKLSSTTVDFIRSEGNLETKCLYWFRKPKMC